MAPHYCKFIKSYQ